MWVCYSLSDAYSVGFCEPCLPRFGEPIVALIDRPPGAARRPIYSEIRFCERLLKLAGGARRSVQTLF
jgi:hypothetical protein